MRDEIEREGYPRCLKLDIKPFDPLTLASWTEDIVSCPPLST